MRKRAATLKADRFESRAAVIAGIKAELSIGAFHRRVLSCRLVGSVVWVVEEITLDSTRRNLRAYILGKARGGFWGFQCLSESASPPLSCPPSFLDLVPPVNPAWRRQVRNHHLQNRSVSV